MGEALAHLPRLHLGGTMAGRVRNGIRPVLTIETAAALGTLSPETPILLMGEGGHPLAVAQVPAMGCVDGETLGLLRVFL
jgi:hypothetical protein